jgi:hypothetical protein
VFQRTVHGLDLRFHLAGINNQNFLMRDEQTGTYWQQITGLAVSGPLKGQRLELIPADELTFALWKTEQPSGTVLNDAPGYVKEYAPKDWDVRMAKMPTVISFAQPGLKPRDLMLGVHTSEAARAFPYNSILEEKLIQDRVGSVPILLVLGADNRSVRVFEQGHSQFYRVPDLKSGALFLDAETGSEWNFRGCAISGPLTGQCLKPVNAIKDYWFDWRNYNPQTTIYRRPASLGSTNAAHPKQTAARSENKAGPAEK